MAGKGDLSDPTWRYITAALDRGKKLARSKGYTWKSDSCFIADAMALSLVVRTREGHRRWAGDNGPTLATNNPRNIALAYADHYLQTRTVTAAASYLGYGVMALDNKIYNDIKFAIQAMQAEPRDAIVPVRAVGDRLEKAMREDPGQPMSRATDESVYWGNAGNADGLRDEATGLWSVLRGRQH